ncbi:MAG: hypothetical protein LUG98_13470 [Tannerellaceae bacterium]|nr:hypothetical protein [Tannerellaceae bacterium]
MSEPGKNILFISEDYIPQVRSFGALGYTPERILILLNLTKQEKLALLCRITTPSDPYHEAYEQGKAIGQYNVDAELMKLAEKGDIDAIKTLSQRQQERIEQDQRKELFGI